MKKVFILIVSLFFLTAQAQDEGKFRLNLDAGLAVFSEGNGVYYGFEPKYNITDNMNVGLKISFLGVSKKLNIAEFGEETYDSNSFSEALTFDYYFNELTNSAFTPFIGAGIQSVGFSEDDFGSAESEMAFGALVRTGFEWHKFRLALEYNIIPKSDFGDFEGNTFSIENSYFGIGLGFFMGGGKW
jgi:outer membrane protein W